MPNGIRQIKRRNHTVNGSYLTRFADDRGLLTGIELPGRRFPVPVDRATVIRNFYVTRLPDGSESDQAEDDFCDIETRAGASKVPFGVIAIAFTEPSLALVIVESSPAGRTHFPPNDASAFTESSGGRGSQRSAPPGAIWHKAVKSA